MAKTITSHTKNSLLLAIGTVLGLTPLLARSATPPTVQLVSPSFVVAGQPTPFEYKITIGNDGIPVKGSLMLGFHHSSQWKGTQISKPQAPGYVSVVGKVPNNFKIKFKKLPASAFTAKGDTLYNRGIVAEVAQQPLQPGEVITIAIGSDQYGGIQQKLSDDHHELRVMADLNADGKFDWSASPQFDVIPAPTHHFLLVAPSKVVANQPFDLQIHAEDAFNNFVNNSYFTTPVPAYNGKVTITDEKGNILAKDIKLDDGWALTQVRVSTPGPHWLTASDGTLKGGSNPFKAFNQEPSYKIYWGDIHGHTKFSDGLGENAEEYFWYAQTGQHLDVCALSDHSQKHWPETIAAVKSFYKPGEFVTLLGFEASLPGGHINLYFRGDTAPLVDDWAKQTYQGLTNSLAQQFGTDLITGPHAFGHDSNEPYAFGAWNDTVERFVEVYSKHGASEYPGNPTPLLNASKDMSHYLQGGLAAGRRFGVIGSGDGHDSHPGRAFGGAYPGGLVAFRAKELTREAIFNAWQNFQVYATSADRIYLDFTINDSWMGAQLTTGDPVRVHYEVIAQTPQVKAELIRNNTVIRSDSSKLGHINIDFTDTPTAPKNFYYLRVTQSNSERAWSTPIWIDKPGAAGKASAPPAVANPPAAPARRAPASASDDDMD
ncbi:hypothetical protein SAMN02949497_3923 [Methylomagnum ishizawai]|uniref:DUF3604 domain-containing protein n=1 Tax=Methylomagnum ishizawai TaxID=1760988 RepID=A0A1Y6D6T1_9GAMM|nr:hypothetical protein [Methylomagnum ishizawai]SMF96523.1 hypothetical protein SAMN02949497_3923 [Methylomagnum ishizawai]